MAIINTGLGGTDASDGEVLFAADLNDTNDRMILIQWLDTATIVYENTATIAATEMYNTVYDVFASDTAAITGNVIFEGVTADGYILAPALLDNFDDNSVDGGIWNDFGSGSQTESSQNMVLATSSGTHSASTVAALADGHGCIIHVAAEAGTSLLLVSAANSSESNLTQIAELSAENVYAFTRDGTDILLHDLVNGGTSTVDASGTGGTMYVQVRTTSSLTISIWYMATIQSISGTVTGVARTSSANGISLCTYHKTFNTDANSTVVAAARSDGGESFENMLITLGTVGSVKPGTPGTAPQDKYTLTNGASATTMPILTFAMIRWHEA